MNPDIKLLALLQQSYTEISSSSDEEERKEYKIAKNTVHLRPGRLKALDRDGKRKYKLLRIF